MKSAKHPGQGLAEYGLIITTVAIVGIAGLVLLGGSMSGGLKEVVASNSGTGAGSDAPPGINDPAPVINMTNTGGVPQAGQTPPPSLPGGIGATPITPANGSSTVSTAGSNGSAITERAAQSMQAIVAELAAKPDMDPNVLSFVTKYANQAHLLATMQHQLEQELIANGGTLSMQRASYYEGTMYEARVEYEAMHNQFKTIQGNPDNKGNPLTWENVWAIQGAAAESSMSAADYNMWASSIGNPDPALRAQQAAGTYSYGPPTDILASSQTQGNGNTMCGNGGDTATCTQTGF